MREFEFDAVDRTSSVKTLAARIAELGMGASIREYLDACALASGALIKAAYKGPGVDVATERYIEAFRRAVAKQ